MIVYKNPHHHQSQKSNPLFLSVPRISESNLKAEEKKKTAAARIVLLYGYPVKSKSFSIFCFDICFCICIELLNGYPVKSRRFSIFWFQNLFLYLNCIALRLSCQVQPSFHIFISRFVFVFVLYYFTVILNRPICYCLSSAKQFEY